MRRLTVLLVLLLLPGCLEPSTPTSSPEGTRLATPMAHPNPRDAPSVAPPTPPRPPTQEVDETWSLAGPFDERRAWTVETGHERLVIRLDVTGPGGHPVEVNRFSFVLAHDGMAVAQQSGRGVSASVGEPGRHAPTVLYDRDDNVTTQDLGEWSIRLWQGQTMLEPGCVCRASLRVFVD